LIGTALGSLTAVVFAYLISQAIYRFIALAREQAAIRAGFRKLSEVYGDVCDPERKAAARETQAGGGRAKTQAAVTRTHDGGF
jgi:hypothetical protein